MHPSRTSSTRILHGLESAWSALGYLVAGILFWGGIGYVVDGMLGISPVLTVIGALMGNFAGIYLLYLRFPHREKDRSRAA